MIDAWGSWGQLSLLGARPSWHWGRLGLAIVKNNFQSAQGHPNVWPTHFLGTPRMFAKCNCFGVAQDCFDAREQSRKRLSEGNAAVECSFGAPGGFHVVGWAKRCPLCCPASQTSQASKQSTTSACEIRNQRVSGPTRPPKGFPILNQTTHTPNALTSRKQQLRQI